MRDYGSQVMGPADLMVYHPRLRCLIALDLKVAQFRPEYVSDLQHRLEGLPGENPPAGILLCVEQTAEFARLLIPTGDSETAARYALELPRTSQLRRWLSMQRAMARERSLR